MYRNPVREGENKMRLRRIKFWLSVFEMKLINLPSICFRKKKWIHYVKKLKQLIEEQITRGDPENRTIKMLQEQMEEWIYSERHLPKKERFFLNKLFLLLE